MRIKGHKYHAQPTVVDNIRFASKKEAARYRELLLLEKAGEISWIRRQPKFVLSVVNPSIIDRDPFTSIGSYVADFVYCSRDGGDVYEDVKGFDTPLSKWKRRHAEAEYGIKVVLV